MSIVNCNLTNFNLDFNSSSSTNPDVKQLNISSTRLFKEGHHNKTSIKIFGGMAFFSYVDVTRVQKTGSRFIVRAKDAIVFIYKCNFSKNTLHAPESGIFHIKKSVITFHDSVFSENEGLSNVVIFAVDDSIVNISGCIFNGNRADIGRVINARNVDDLNIIDSKFINNTAYQTGVFIVSSYKRMTIHNSTFLHNMATFGSVLHFVNLGWDFSYSIQATILVSKCIFEENQSPSASVFDVESKMKVKIVDSIFIRNDAQMGSVIQIANLAKAAIQNTMFPSNTGNRLLWAHLNVTLSLSNCMISNHSSGSSVILVSSGIRLTMSRCTFVNNSWLIHGDGIVIAELSSSVTVNSCMFNGNSALEGGVFYVHLFSKLNIQSSMFVNNSVMNGYGGVARLENSVASFHNVQASNFSSPWGGGGVIASSYSQITVTNCTLRANSAMNGGAIYLGPNNGLAAFNCLFDENSAEKGYTLYKVGTGNVSLENCTLRNRKGIAGASMFFKDSNYLRLSRGLCRYQKAKEATCIEFEWSSSKYQYTLFTLNYTVSNGIDAINSGYDGNFFNNGTKHGMIAVHINTQVIPTQLNPWKETPFASRMYLFLAKHLF